MDWDWVYNTPDWRGAVVLVRERDEGRCTVCRLLGGPCSGRLHVHHIVPLEEGGAKFDLDNLGTVCARHHPMWESLRRELVRRLTAAPEIPRCPHPHRTAEARQQCEARMARRHQAAA